MPAEITKAQAADMYLSQLQSEAAKMMPVDRTIKRFAVKGPTGAMIYLSYVDLIAEVQNKTSIGLMKAVEYVQQLQTPKGEQMYLIVG